MTDIMTNVERIVGKVRCKEIRDRISVEAHSVETICRTHEPYIVDELR